MSVATHAIANNVKELQCACWHFSAIWDPTQIDLQANFPRNEGLGG